MANRPKKKKTETPQAADLVKDFERTINETARDSIKTYNDPTFAVTDADIWVEGTLLNFADFSTSTDHMNFPTVSDRQKEVADAMFGNDPKKIFDTNRNTAVLMWGKGAGKDTISAMMLLYIVYVVLHLRNPQKYFDRPQFSSIDIINVAYNKEQAQEVYFD